MKRLLKNNFVVITAFVFVVLINFLFFARYFIFPCDITQQLSLALCEERNAVLKISNNISTDNVVVTVIGGGLDVAAILFLLKLIKDKTSAKRSFQKDYFPFKQLTTSQFEVVNGYETDERMQTD